jgi:CRISPR system Cascade subunit CasA
MQVAALATAEETKDKRKPWTQIALASACGSTPLVFDHACDDSPIAIRSAEALAMLLGCLQFVPGGLVKTLRDSDKAGALANTAAALPVGETLAQTLCLCLHPAPTGNGEPDLPAWEREPLTVSQLRGASVLATGCNDRYSRQSRAVLLMREEDGTICWLRFAAGFALGEDANAPDPMASFRAGSNGLVRLTFTEGRAFWRDLPALVLNPSGETQPAAILNHAITLHQVDSFDEIFQPLLIAGLASDQAKLLRWRIEQIVLPAALLMEVEKAGSLREQVARSEELFTDLSKVAVSMLADTLPDPSSKDTRSRARDLLNTGSFTNNYFSFVERVLPKLLRLLGKGDYEKADVLWCATLRNASLDAWKQLLASLGYSARALRADARFLPRFYGVLRKHVPKSETENPKED